MCCSFIFLKFQVPSSKFQVNGNNFFTVNLQPGTWNFVTLSFCGEVY
jgi:hypothetical protein